MPDIWLPPMLGMPPPLSPLLPAYIGSNTTLTSHVSYFKTLTVDAGVTLTGVAGGTVIVVQDFANILGTISVAGLGAKPGGANRAPGYGGGIYGYAAHDHTMDKGFLSEAVNGATHSWRDNDTFLQVFMPLGSTSRGGNGNSWPDTAAAAYLQVPTGIGLLDYLWAMIRARHTDHATYGAIGGGGGGLNDFLASTGTGVPGVAYGYGAMPGEMVGGSGFGAGGTSNSVQSGGSDPGRGGGVLILICGWLGGNGTLSANGQASNAATPDGGGGGGAVVAAYNHKESTIPTLSANGGLGGQHASGHGGNGGTGLTASFLIEQGLQ